MRRREVPHRALILSATVALAVAGLLVVYLQRRSVERQREQTARIVGQVCEQTATVLAAQVRQLFDGAVFETLEGISHPELREYDLPRIAERFGAGLNKHPYVDRFFFWSEMLTPPLRDQVLFFHPNPGPPTGEIPIASADGRPLGVFVAEPWVGRLIFGLARERAPSRRSFAVIDRVIGDTPYEIVIHFLWNDEYRKAFFAIIGYTVDLRRVREPAMLAALVGRNLPATFDRDPTLPQLALTVIDEHGRLVYGSRVDQSLPAATSSVNMVFFPVDAFRPWLGERPDARRWHLTVSAGAPGTGVTTEGYWLVAAVVFLILIALFCAITVDRQAVHLAQMQSAFVANVSHQLKTPLSLLSGACDTLRLERVRSPEKIKEYVEIVRAQTTRLSALVDKILHFSRIEDTRRALDLRPLDLVDLVRTSVGAFTHGLPNGDISFRFESPAESVLVKADSVALEQAVLNLLENAMKYSNGRNEVTVRVLSRAQHAVIAVRDQGIGIDPVDMPHIFDKFYRGANNSGRRGFGLGLAMVQAIVHAHGGHVHVHSRPGSGTEFEILVPSL